MVKKKKVEVKSEHCLMFEQKMRENSSFYIEKDYGSPPGWHEPEGNAQITLLFNEDGMSIEVFDKKASLPIFEIVLDKDKTLQVLSRYARTYCDMKTYNLDKIGKKMKMATLYVNLGNNVSWHDREDAKEKILKSTPEGWEADLFLNSQETFFQFEGDSWVQTTIRRWE
jgi:hypothetical protein